MCAIVGALVPTLHESADRREANRIMNHIMRESHERGRDGRGYVVRTQGGIPSSVRFVNRVEEGDKWQDRTFFSGHILCGSVVGNLRAEPTTEYVKDKQPEDQQPYSLGGWNVVHNGTIANDKELRDYTLQTKIDSAAIVERLVQYGTPKHEGQVGEFFRAAIKSVRGSFAIIASNDSYPGRLCVAANYRPVWYISTSVGMFFASSRNYFPDDYVPQMLTPYSIAIFDAKVENVQLSTLLRLPNDFTGRALVVCSGGLDSVVAATYAKKVLQMDTELIHFRYGSRAEGPEVRAVSEVAEALGVNVTYFDLPVYKPGDSPLLQQDSTIAGGEEGAEFAHEWVPARNLLLLSVATAYAEANRFDTIVLGNNLEEAGAYPDNEPEFINRFNDLLPFAVGDGKYVRVIMPVGNMMKHEIVRMGLDLEAPMDKTWSCYRAGKLHCGKCGPCFMRRTAFEINGAAEVITYEN